MREAAAPHEPLPRFPVDHWELSNGLRVVLQPDPGAPLVASTMCFSTGSRHDPGGRRGLAHLCEHLAFEGPRRAAGGSYPERIERAGGTARAMTMADRLCFSAVFPRGELAAVLAVEAERMAAPLGPRDVEALEIQRRVLLEELRERSERRVHAAAVEHVHRLLFPPDHPYHRPPAGEPDGIRAITVDEVESFCAAAFRPGNAVLVLVGDLDLAAAAGQVRRSFEALPAGADQAPELASRRQPRAGARRQTVPAAEPQARTHLAWAVQGFGHEEWYQAALLMRGLAAGRSSPLVRELVERTGLAREVRGSLVAMRDASTLALTAVGAPGVEGRRLEEALLAAADRLLARGLSAAELLRARKRALTDHYFVVQYLDRRADLCAALSCYLGAPERLPTEPLRYSHPDQEAIGGFACRLRQDPDRAVLSFTPGAAAA